MLDRGPKRYQRFFAELKRRHVFRVMAVYGAVAFVLLQLADLVFPALQLPPWAMRLLLALTVFGFPIAIVLAWAFEQSPDGWKRTERADPEEIEAIVSQPASRRWPAGLLALLGVAALVAGAWWVGRQTALEVGTAADTAEMRLVLADAEEETQPTIAVLPFADMSPEGDQEYFSDGITEELLNTLARIPQLKVMARTSAFAFKGENLDVRSVSDSLGAQYLVEGSVRKAGDKLRITAQLIDGEDGSHLWTQQYDRELDDVFTIQSEIAESISGELRVPLGLDEDEQLVSPTEDLAAYDLYLTARARMRERGEGVGEAVELFEAAIARDSTWAPAWAGLAESLVLLPYYNTASRDSAEWAELLSRAEGAAERALRLQPKHATAILALANVYRDRHEWERAEVAYLRALSLEPNSVDAYQEYAEYLNHVGRAAEAYEAAKRALSLDRAPIRLWVASEAARLAGRFEEAVSLAEEGLRRDPTGGSSGILRGTLIRSYFGVEDWEAARAEALPPEGEATEAEEQLRAVWPAEGRITPEVVEFMEAMGADMPAAHMWMALDEPERALEILQAGADDIPPYGYHGGWMFSPAFDPLRNDPRFQEILARFDLEGRRPQRLESVE